VRPISSFGLVCFRNALADGGAPSYLMVQRKDSMQFVEFVRGKYVPSDGESLAAMVSRMTPDEQALLVSSPFLALWTRVWGAGVPRRCLAIEFVASAALHAELTSGACGHTLADVVSACSGACIPEREWGFPKGRRNIREADSDCAMREFSEETGMPSWAVRRMDTSFEEVFTGTNGVRYRHKYFLAHHAGSSPPETGACVSPTTDAQAREIACACWMTFEQAASKLASSPTRLAVLTNVHTEARRLSSCGQDAA
jgi:ADP-ribose pyrophosphatase YjhB (NUDIX family)